MNLCILNVFKSHQFKKTKAQFYSVNKQGTTREPPAGSMQQVKIKFNQVV